MFKYTIIFAAIAGLVLALAPAAQAAVAMEFVPVGNAGNAADSTGYGAVAYDYLIGKYEVTAAEWAAAIAADPNVGNAGSWTGNQPTASASWHEAAKFCNWMTTGDAQSGYYSTAHTGGTYDDTPGHGLNHKQYADTYGTTYFIPTENEWYKAAYHNNAGLTVTDYYDYPTGSDTAPTGEAPIGTDLTNGSANYTPATGEPGYGYTPAAPVDVGSYTYKPSDSHYGTFDQGGNVWEWNEWAWPGNLSEKGKRAGAWNSAADLLVRGRSGDLDRGGQDDEWNTVGFRVSMIPEPATLALLAFGGIGILVRRRGHRR